MTIAVKHINSKKKTIASKEAIKRALSELKSERERKKFRRMTDTDTQAEMNTSAEIPNISESKNQTERANLLQASQLEAAKMAWNCYAKRTKQLLEELSIAENFGKYNVYDLQTKMTRLQNVVKELDDQDLQVKLVTGLNPDERDQQHEEIIALADVIQAKILSRIAELRSSERHHGIAQKRPSTAAGQPTAADIADSQPVPKKQITWGMFAGSVYEWQGFAKRFKQEVDQDQSLTPDDKLLLLQKSCFDKAKEVIDSADKSYEKAWQILNETYGNVYNTMHYAIQRIMTYPTIAVASYDEITRLIRAGKKCMEMIDGVNAADKFDPFLVILAASKLDGSTSKAWVRYRSLLANTWAEVLDKDNKPQEKRLFMPAWDEFVKFLKEECGMYVQQDIHQSLVTGIAPGTSMNRISIGADPGTSGVGSNEHPPAQANARANPFEKRAPQSDLQCKLCSGTHMPYKCDEFKKLNMTQRWDHVQRSGLCPRCLRKYHQGDCVNKTNNECCNRCWQRFNKEVRHNSALCPIASGYANEQPRSSDPVDEDWEN